MNLFPINLDIRGRKAVIVGGGSVGQRKCRSLLDAEVAVTVIALDATTELRSLADQGLITLLLRAWQPGDLDGACLVFATANDRGVNHLVTEEAKRLGIPVCVADKPEEGTFTSPSVVRRGDLLLTVSTGGRSPALARRIREDLEDRYGPEYAAIVTCCGAFREKLLTEQGESAYNKQLFNELLDRFLPRIPSTDDADDRTRLVRELLGSDDSPERLAEDTEEPS